MYTRPSFTTEGRVILALCEDAARTEDSPVSSLWRQWLASRYTEPAA
jgi:hypothetical protein